MSPPGPPAAPPADLRRVTVVAPRVRMDVGLPAQCTLAELIPQLVRLAGAVPPPPRGGRAEATNRHWLLTRVGGSPLPAEWTVAAASIQHGEVLALSPHAGYAPPLLFDDVVDAIASAAQNRRGAWRPTVGRRLGLAVALTLFVATTVFVLAGMFGRPPAPAAAGVIAVALLLVGGALARAYGDARAAGACAGAGTAAALGAGLAALPPHTVWPVGAETLALGLAAVTLYAALAVAIVQRDLWFVSALVASAAGALITASVLLFDVPAPHAAAVALPLLTAVTAGAPAICLRLARLPLPVVPEDMAAFRADERPALGAEVLGPTSAAAGLLTALVGALGVAAAGCCVVLLADRSVWSTILLALVATAWLLRSRSFAGAAQRVTLVVVGLAMVAALGYRLISSMRPEWLLAVAAVTGLAAALCLVYAERVVRNLHSPFRARWLDVLEYLVLLSLIPVAGAILDIYNAVRDAVG